MNVETTADDIRIEVELPVRLLDAWSLVTERKHVARWWGDHVDFEARPGGKLIEKWSDGEREVVTSGEVTRCVAPSCLAMTWADDDWPGTTIVAFDLAAAGDRTRLVLRHTGWDVHAAGERERLIDAHAAGWSAHLDALRDYASGVRHDRSQA